MSVAETETRPGRKMLRCGETYSLIMLSCREEIEITRYPRVSLYRLYTYKCVQCRVLNLQICRFNSHHQTENLFRCHPIFSCAKFLQRKSRLCVCVCVWSTHRPRFIQHISRNSNSS